MGVVSKVILLLLSAYLIHQSASSISFVGNEIRTPVFPRIPDFQSISVSGDEVTVVSLNNSDFDYLNFWIPTEVHRGKRDTQAQGTLNNCTTAINLVKLFLSNTFNQQAINYIRDENEFQPGLVVSLSFLTKYGLAMESVEYPTRAVRGTPVHGHGSKKHTTYHTTKAPHYVEEQYKTPKPVKSYRNVTKGHQGEYAETDDTYEGQIETYEAPAPVHLDYFDQEDILFLYNLNEFAEDSKYVFKHLVYILDFMEDLIDANVPSNTTTVNTNTTAAA